MPAPLGSAFLGVPRSILVAGLISAPQSHWDFGIFGSFSVEQELLWLSVLVSAQFQPVALLVYLNIQNNKRAGGEDARAEHLEQVLLLLLQIKRPLLRLDVTYTNGTMPQVPSNCPAASQPEADEPLEPARRPFSSHEQILWSHLWSIVSFCCWDR